MGIGGEFTSMEPHGKKLVEMASHRPRLPKVEELSSIPNRYLEQEVHLVTNPNLPSTRNVSGEGRDSGGGFGSRDAVLGEKEGRSGKRVGKRGKG